MSNLCGLVYFIACIVVYTTAQQQRQQGLPKITPQLHSLQKHTTFAHNEICELFNTHPQIQQKFLGNFDNIILYYSTTTTQQQNITTTTQILQQQNLGEYNAQKNAYFLLEKQVYFSTNFLWRQKLGDFLSSVEVSAHDIQLGKVLARVDKKSEQFLLQQISSTTTIISPLIYRKVACGRVDYTQEFKNLVKTHEEPDPYIQSLVAGVSQEDLRFFVEYLSGEAEGSPILTRNSLSQGGVTASQWLLKEFASFGFTVSTQPYRDGYSENVVAIWPGGFENNTEVVVVGAHYDSRASNVNSPTDRAPGANDDGSGTSTLLQIAKIISSQNVRFLRTIHLVAFSGEEQGLYGSAAYANKLVEDKANVVAMLQADMIAYQKPGSPPLLGFPLNYTTPALTEVAITAANTYAPGTSTGRNSRCCSDHRSFFSVGFAATDFSDTHGPIADPAYHSVNDVANREGFSFEQLAFNAQAMFATLLVVARPAH